MPEQLTLAEFKTRLADQVEREALGITMTDAQALRTIIDDQQVAELYVKWRTGALSAPSIAATAEPPVKRLPYRRPAIIVAAIAGVIVLIVMGVVGFNTLREQMRKQQYAEILSNDSTVSENLRTLNGEELDASFRVNCDAAREGETLTARVAEAHRNWEAVEAHANVTREQFIANNVGTFKAARAACG